MNTYVETNCMTRKSDAALDPPLRIDTDSEIKKQRWIGKYSDRLLGQWLRWQTPLGVTHAYAARIKEDLVEFYEDPLKRMFIEATYYSHQSDILDSCL